MVAIQFSDRFLGVQPNRCEGHKFRQKLSAKLLCVPAAGVEVPGQLIEIAADLAALSQQGRENVQGILSAACNKNGVLDGLFQQRLTNEGRHADVEPFAAEFEGEFFFFGHAKFDDVSAVVGIVVVSGWNSIYGVLGEYQPPIFWAVL